MELAKTGLHMGAHRYFYGCRYSTCRKLIDDGVIGEPIGAECAMICHGHETWHPTRSFIIMGGGPMMDMGPYYVTALVHLLGRWIPFRALPRLSFRNASSPLSPIMVKDPGGCGYLSG